MPSSVQKMFFRAALSGVFLLTWSAALPAQDVPAKAGRKVR